MKILCLLVILTYIYCCSAAANRSTVWLLADELLYSTSKTYQYCDQLGASPANVNRSLLSNSYYRFSMSINTAGADVAAYSTVGAVAGLVSVAANFVVKSLQLSFISPDSSTPNVVFTLPIYTSGSVSLKSLIPTGTYYTTAGSTWLTVRQIDASANYPTTGQSVSTLSYGAILIIDYRSSSTIMIQQYQEGDDIFTAATPPVAVSTYNHIYSIAVRAPTTLLASGSSTDLLTAGCSTPATRTGTPATVKTATLGTCSVSGAIDSSLSGSTACTNTALPDAVTIAVSALNTLRTTDNTLFGAAGSKFAIAANFGILVALSSIIFSFF